MNSLDSEYICTKKTVFWILDVSLLIRHPKRDNNIRKNNDKCDKWVMW